MRKILLYSIPALVLFGVLAIGVIAIEAQGIGKGLNNENKPISCFENLTEEQKELLLEKKEEMKNLKDELKNLEPEERHEKMQELKQQLTEWAEENGIDCNFGFLKGPGNGFRKGFRGIGPKNCPLTE